MKIKVYGKPHMEGTGKKIGKSHNFNQVHYLGKARSAERHSGETLIWEPKDYPIENIIVGVEYTGESLPPLSLPLYELEFKRKELEVKD